MKFSKQAITTSVSIVHSNTKGVQSLSLFMNPRTFRVPSLVGVTFGKDNTWKIERRNLNFRTHLKRLNRKTICFSKSEKIHDNVIGIYINHFYFTTGLYSEAA